MAYYNDSIQALRNRKAEIVKMEEELLHDIIKDFMEKYNTNKIYFDWQNQDCPDWTYIPYDGDGEDAQVEWIEFNDDYKLEKAKAYLYYRSDDCEVEGKPYYDFYDVHKLELIEFINDQLSERYVPEEE